MPQDSLPSGSKRARRHDITESKLHEKCFTLLHYFTKKKLYSNVLFLILEEEPASKKVCSDDNERTKESE